jgi:hypothetical protein
VAAIAIKPRLGICLPIAELKIESPALAITSQSALGRDCLQDGVADRRVEMRDAETGKIPVEEAADCGAAARDENDKKRERPARRPVPSDWLQEEFGG